MRLLQRVELFLDRFRTLIAVAWPRRLKPVAVRAVLFASVMAAMTSGAAAHEPTLGEAQLALRKAQLRLYQCRYVDYPRERRALDDAIRLTKAEAAVLDRRIEDYRPFRTVGRYSPTVTAEQNARLNRLAAGQELRQLKDERSNLWRVYAARCQVLELKVLQAAQKVASLMPEKIE